MIPTIRSRIWTSEVVACSSQLLWKIPFAITNAKSPLERHSRKLITRNCHSKYLSLLDVISSEVLYFL